VTAAELEAVARGFFEAFARGDVEASLALLAPDVVAWVTNADGGVDEVRGRDAYRGRIPDMDSAEWRIDVTQVLAIDAERVLTAVEIRAHRHGRDLHNFAAFLARVAGGLIAELWMVEARPAYSDEFWS
jgi:ketosteroid isomerase-like protein